ncbi:MAG: KEOPS complex subunit Cgi121 [Candidatus Bathyarchaeota archaeon]
MATTKNDKTISILGFRNVRIDDVDSFLKRVKVGIYPATVQIVDATRVAGKSHLFFAFLNAKKSFEEKRALSENLTMETLLYASGSRQISRAIEMLGVKANTSKIAAIVFASSEEEVKKAEDMLMKIIPGVKDDSVLDIKGRAKVDGLKKTFGVTDLELETMTHSGTVVKEALTWLIVERVSLLSVKK